MTAVAEPTTLAGPPARGSRTRLRLWLLAGLVVLLVLAIAASFSFGARGIPLATVWQLLLHPDGSPESLIVHDLRVPRTILAILAGAALGLAGALMQTLTRNPLADPGILGVNAGASLAVVIAIAFFGISDVSGTIWFSLAGAFLASLLVYALGSAGRAGASPVRLALAGAALTAVLAAIVDAIVLLNVQAFSGYRAWSVGDLSGRELSVAFQTLPFVVVGVVATLLMARPLNVLSLGDEQASALGAQVGRTRLGGVVVVTLLCGAATAAVGPIAFVGLVVPHAVRGVSGPDHRWLLPYCLLLGPSLLLLADVVGRVVISPSELQAGIMTAVVGAPVFIAIVRRRRLMQL